MVNNKELNVHSAFNDDETGERTAYYMTGTMFGCLSQHKAMKDSVWDYDSMECNYCHSPFTPDVPFHEDGDLGYHVISPHDDDFALYVDEWNDVRFRFTLFGNDATSSCHGPAAFIKMFLCISVNAVLKLSLKLCPFSWSSRRKRFCVEAPFFWVNDGGHY